MGLCAKCCKPAGKYVFCAKCEEKCTTKVAPEKLHPTKQSRIDIPDVFIANIAEIPKRKSK